MDLASAGTARTLSRGRKATLSFVAAAVLTAATAAQGSAPPTRGADVGIGIGAVAPDGAGYALDPALSLKADLRVPVGDRLWLEPEVGYWQRTPDIQNSISRVLNVGINLLVSFGTRSSRAWAGFGPGLHLLEYQGVFTNAGGEVVLGNDPFVNPAARLQLLAGYDQAVSARTTVFLEGRLDTAFLPGDDDLPRQWKIHLGFRWRLR